MIYFVLGVIVGVLIVAAVAEKYMGPEVSARVKAEVDHIRADLEKAHTAYRTEVTAAHAKLTAKLVQAQTALEKTRKDLADKIAPKP